VHRHRGTGYPIGPLLFEASDRARLYDPPGQKTNLAVNFFLTYSTCMDPRCRYCGSLQYCNCRDRSPAERRALQAIHRPELYAEREVKNAKWRAWDARIQTRNRKLSKKLT